MSKRTCENETALLLMGRKTFTGTLQGVKDGSVNIDCEDGKYTMPNAKQRRKSRSKAKSRSARSTLECEQEDLLE